MTTQPPDSKRLSSVPSETRKVSRQPARTVSSIRADKSELLRHLSLRMVVECSEQSEELIETTDSCNKTDSKGITTMPFLVFERKLVEYDLKAD